MTLNIFFCLFYIINAHNWIHSRSRAKKASTIQPAPPRPGTFAPHIRVGQNQEFGFEWATGHSKSRYYFVVLHSKHEDKLSEHTIKNLDAYLNQASASDELKGSQWQKRHVSCGFSNTCNDAKHPNDGSQYKKQLSSGDELYFDRPESWGDAGISQFQYTDAKLKNDKRVSYENPKWPWIEAVHSFEVAHSFPREWDISNFKIEGKEGPGHYLIHMVWRGYRDVIDVDLLAQPSTDIYGRAGSDDDWNKVNHCQHKYYKTGNKSYNKCMFIDPTNRNVKKCLNSCKRNQKCTAVNVVPLYNPESVAFDEVNIPWNNDKCTKKMAEGYDYGTLVCYGLKEKPDPHGNPDVGYPYTVVDNDPEDPIYYSTCYTMNTNWVFDGFDGSTTKPQPSILSYKVGDKCISCKDIDRISKTKMQVVPWWKTANECEKCW